METFKWERILVPTDFSPFAETAVRYAHGLAEVCKAELHVLHVARDPSELSRSVMGTIDPAEGENQYQGWLASLVGEPGKVRRVEAVRIGGDIPDTISAYARKHDIDLIVIASHGRSGLAHLLVGSVAEQLLRSSLCPVLVVRPGPDKRS
jgi:nucleotide-binding universal stress UspA family protein